MPLSAPAVTQPTLLQACAAPLAVAQASGKVRLAASVGSSLASGAIALLEAQGVEGLSGSGPADWQVVQPSSSIKVRVGTEKASQGEAGRSVCPGSPLPRLRAKAEASPGGQPAPPACCRALSSGHKLPACDACTALAVPQVDPGYLSEPVAVEFATEGGLTAFMNYYAPRNKVRPCCVSLLLPCVLRLWQRSMRMAFGDGSCRPSAPCPRASALPLTPSPRNNTTQQQRKHKKQHPPPPAGLRPAAGQPAAAAGEDPRGPHLSGQHRLLPGPAVLDQPGWAAGPACVCMCGVGGRGGTVCLCMCVYVGWWWSGSERVWWWFEVCGWVGGWVFRAS
jgi:hypothetical protein